MTDTALYGSNVKPDMLKLEVKERKKLFCRTENHSLIHV